MQKHRLKAIGAALAVAALLADAAAAQTETVLYNFSSVHGREPSGRLVLDKSGGLYGITERGGARNEGTAFELSQSDGTWNESVLYSFDGRGGKYPVAGLRQDSQGGLYGTAQNGGRAFGTVFQLTNSGGSWTDHVLYKFGGDADGEYPASIITRDDATGALYGTTQFGGSANCGTVFKLSQSRGRWTKAVLYNFKGVPDGCFPYIAGLHEDSTGALYSVTGTGGQYNEGTVYKLTSNGQTWTELVLYSFTGGNDGQYPYDLDLDPSGALYGVTELGGQYGEGTAFVLTQSGRRWKESVIHDFGGGSDGEDPVGLLLDKKTGAIYATSQGGGVNRGGDLVELTRSRGSWKEVVLHDFGGANDGYGPGGRVIEDERTGALYGTTSFGGTHYDGIAYEVTR